MTAPAKFALNNINGLASMPVLRNYGVLSRSSLRGAAVAAPDSAGNKPAKPAKPSPESVESENFGEFVGKPRRFTAASLASTTTKPKRARPALTPENDR